MIDRSKSATIGNWKVMMIVAFYQDMVLGYQVLPKNKYVDNRLYLEFLENVVLKYVDKNIEFDIQLSYTIMHDHINIEILKSSLRDIDGRD